VHRLLAAAFLASLAAQPVRAQAAFIAPSSTSIVGEAQATATTAPERFFFVANHASVPIVVFSFDLASCVNVKQPCGSQPTEVVVPAGGRVRIGRVEALDRRRRFTYDWSFQYRPDTSDARIASVLREHGLLAPILGRAENLASGAADAAPAVAAPPAGALRDRITAEERQAKVVALDANNRPIPMSERYRFKVAYGSILASTQTPGKPILPTGACINPAELAGYERDTTIIGEPAVAPALSASSITLPTLPPELRGTAPQGATVLVRWAVDTTGASVPGSVEVLESPSGLLSVKVCGAILGAHLSPGRDASGHPVRTWVQAPLRIVE
jgi:hypothetical protein